MECKGRKGKREKGEKAKDLLNPRFPPGLGTFVAKVRFGTLADATHQIYYPTKKRKRHERCCPILFSPFSPFPLFPFSPFFPLFPSMIRLPYFSRSQLGVILLLGAALLLLIRLAGPRPLPPLPSPARDHEPGLRGGDRERWPIPGFTPFPSPPP